VGTGLLAVGVPLLADLAVEPLAVTAPLVLALHEIRHVRVQRAGSPLVDRAGRRLGEVLVAVDGPETADFEKGRSLPPEERPLLEAQAGQDLLHPRVRERPDPLPQAGLLHRRDLRDNHDAPLGEVPLARLEQDVPGPTRPA
jgi:hypothetical protein